MPLVCRGVYLPPLGPCPPPLLFNLEHPSGASRDGDVCNTECIKLLTALLISSLPLHNVRYVQADRQAPVPYFEGLCPFPFSLERPLALAHSDVEQGCVSLTQDGSPLPAQRDHPHCWQTPSSGQQLRPQGSHLRGEEGLGGKQGTSGGVNCQN